MLKLVENLKQKSDGRLYFFTFSLFTALLVVRESKFSHWYDFLPIFGRSIPFVTLTICLLFIYKLRGGNLPDLGLSWPLMNKPIWKQLIWILIRAGLIFAIGLIVGSIVMELFDIIDGPRQETLSRMTPLVNNASLDFFLYPIMCVVVIAEELLFRGLFMNYLASKWGRTTASWLAAIIVTSIIFGMAHFWQGYRGMVGTGFAALIFGFGYYLSKRNLWPVIVAHIAGNTVGFLALSDAV